MTDDRQHRSSGRSGPRRRTPAELADQALLRHSLARGYLSREALEDLRRRQARERSAGRRGELLELLADLVPESVSRELADVHGRALSSSPPGPATPVSGDGSTVEGRSTRWGAPRIVAVAVGVLVTIGFLWLGVRPGAGPDQGPVTTGSTEVRRQLLTLLGSPSGSALPDVHGLLVRVSSLRGAAEMTLLRELLSSDRATVRLNAARLLVVLGDATVGERLAEIAQTADELERLVALDGLGRLRGVRPVELLMGSLRSARVDVRHYAVGALEDDGSARALGSLWKIVDHPDPQTRVAVRRAVLSLDPTRALARLDPTPANATTVPRGETSGAVAAQSSSSIVASPDDPAAEPVGELGGHRIANDLDAPERVALAAGDARQPSGAVASGAGPAAAAGVTPGVDATSSKPPKAKPPKAKPTPAVKAPSPAAVARREVPRLLERAEYGGALRAGGVAIANRAVDDAELFRLQGRAHLGLGSTPEALASLRRAIDLEPDLAPAYFDMALCYGARKDRRSAYTALTMALRLGFRDLVAIRNDDRLDGIEESEAFRRLMDHYFYSPLSAEVDPAKRLSFSCKRLRSAFARLEDPFLRALEVTRFPESGGPEATEFLCRFLKDRSIIVRRALAEVLGRTTDPDSVAFLCDRALNSRTGVEQKTALMWALAGLEGPGPLDALLAGLVDGDAGVRVAAARALGDRPDRRAVEPLIELLDDASPLDRLTVARALGKISGEDFGVEAIDWRNWWRTRGKQAEIGPVRDPCRRGVVSGSRTVVIPAAFSERSGKARARALRRFGGSAQTEAAVSRALEWLARHQDPAGHWDTDEWARRCDERKPWERVTRVRRRAWDTQVTGLALLAFLGAGHTHREGEHADSIRRGLAFLRKRQRADGYFSGDHHHQLRSHEIATVAMAEAYLLTRDCELLPHVERAVRWILARQHANGGWGWHARESYTSLTGWNLMALMTASQAGVRVPATSLVAARDFLDRVTLAQAGAEGRQGFAFETLRPAAEVGEALSVEEHEEVRGGGGALSTAVALWCRTFLGRGDGDVRVRGARAQLNRPPTLDAEGKVRLNEWLFFATQCALLQGGSSWKGWNRGMKEALLGSIVREGCERGSWAPSTDHGRVLATALGALLLESYYRFHGEPQG